MQTPPNNNAMVVPHDPQWGPMFHIESSALQQKLGQVAVKFHHIGSTAIRDIRAKPIIDILGVVGSLHELDLLHDPLRPLGYEAMGEFGLKGRRYFRKVDVDGTRTHHLHIYQHGSPAILRHLAFRDYLIAHPEIAQAYSDLKRDLVDQSIDWNTYIDGKDSFVKRIEADAIFWASP